MSDERSSGTLSSAYPSDAVTGCAQGTVRKAGALAVKNFLVHKKNKKVEPAARRKWKHYWVSLRGVVDSYFYVEDLWFFCFFVFDRWKQLEMREYKAKGYRSLFKKRIL